SIATSTVRRGAKPVKLLIISVRIRSNPGTDKRLTGRTTSPVAGLVTSRSKRLKTPDSTTTSAANRANRVAGCGRAFPTRSTTLRKREKTELGLLLSTSVIRGRFLVQRKGFRNAVPFTWFPEIGSAI